MPVGHPVGRRGQVRRTGVLAAAVLAAILALTGCTTFDKASTAAFVNGTAISDATVATVTTQFNTGLATTAEQKIKESQALGVLILAPFVLNQVKASGSWTPDARYNAALQKIPALREEFCEDVNVLGANEELNQSLEKAGRVADFLELGELMCLDALERRESCGGHFREEFQTPEGEALRDDEHFAHVAAWEYTGPKSRPIRHQEPLSFEYVHLTQRSYK